MNSRLTEAELDAQIASKREPQPSMWQDEIDEPLLLPAYGWTFAAVILASAILARCS